MQKFTHRVTQTFDTLAASYPFLFHCTLKNTTTERKTNFFLNFFQVLNTGGQLTLRAAPQPPQQQQTPQQQQPNNRIMTQQQQQYDQYQQQQQQQQQNPVYQQPHQHHSANELYDMYDEYATGMPFTQLISRKMKRSTVLKLQNFSATQIFRQIIVGKFLKALLFLAFKSCHIFPKSKNHIL